MVNNHPTFSLDVDSLKIVNNSDYTIWYKEEDSSVTHSIAPHSTYDGTQDGLTSHLHHDMVYKTCNNINATVNADGTIDWSGETLIQQLAQIASGGWKDTHWLNDLHNQTPPDYGWDELFLRAE